MQENAGSFLRIQSVSLCLCIGKLSPLMLTDIKEYLQDIYVDIDDMDNLQEKMDILNQHLSEYGYHVQIESEDTYCALAYFLMLKQK